MANNARRLSATPVAAVLAATAVPLTGDPAPVAVATEVADDPSSEPITLAPEVNTGGVARLMMSDKPLGFEEMAAEKNTVAVAEPAPEPVSEPVQTYEPSTNDAGISHSVLARTLAEQEAGRAAVARRTADSVRGREITARENAKALAEGRAAHPDDLAYNDRK